MFLNLYKKIFMNKIIKIIQIFTNDLNLKDILLLMIHLNPIKILLYLL